MGYASTFFFLDFRMELPSLQAGRCSGAKYLSSLSTVAEPSGQGMRVSRTSPMKIYGSKIPGKLYIEIQQIYVGEFRYLSMPCGSLPLMQFFIALILHVEWKLWLSFSVSSILSSKANSHPQIRSSVSQILSPGHFRQYEPAKSPGRGIPT